MGINLLKGYARHVRNLYEVIIMSATAQNIAQMYDQLSEREQSIIAELISQLIAIRNTTLFYTARLIAHYLALRMAFNQNTKLKTTNGAKMANHTGCC